MYTETTEKYQEVYQAAEKLFGERPDWVTFFREVLGITGVVRNAFADLETLTEFEQSKEFEGIQQMLAKLREPNATEQESLEPNRVITVRLPQSLHESLRAEAHQRRTSMNKLCISKLLQIVDGELVPAE